MRLFRPPRDDLFRYRKRKQIARDGSVPGIHYSQPRGEYVTAPLGPWGSPPKDYVPPPPQAYEPHPGFAEFPHPECEAYEWEMSPPATRSRRAASPEMPSSDGPPGYDACLMTDELLEQVMSEVASPPEMPESFDHDANAPELMPGPLDEISDYL